MTFEIIRKLEDVRPTPNDVDFSPVFDVINGQVPISKVEELMIDAANFGYEKGGNDATMECVWELVRAERLQEEFDALRRGNTKLLNSLMDMVNQFFYHRGEDGKADEDGPYLYHSFMSAEEYAIATLIKAGFAVETNKGYILLWDKINERVEEEREVEK